MVTVFRLRHARESRNSSKFPANFWDFLHPLCNYVWDIGTARFTVKLFRYMLLLLFYVLHSHHAGVSKNTLTLVDIDIKIRKQLSARLLCVFFFLFFYIDIIFTLLITSDFVDIEIGACETSMINMSSDSFCYTNTCQQLYHSWDWRFLLSRKLFQIEIINYKQLLK